MQLTPTQLKFVNATIANLRKANDLIDYDSDANLDLKDCYGTKGIEVMLNYLEQVFVETE